MRLIDIAPPGTERIDLGDLCPGGAVTVRGLTEGEWCAVLDSEGPERANRVLVGVVAVEGVEDADGAALTAQGFVAGLLAGRSPAIGKIAEQIANAIVARSTPGPGQGA